MVLPGCHMPPIHCPLQPSLTLAPLQQAESYTEAAQSWDDDGSQPVCTAQPGYPTWDDDDGNQPVHAPAAEPTWDDDGSEPVKAEGWQSDGAQVLF